MALTSLGFAPLAAGRPARRFAAQSRLLAEVQSLTAPRVRTGRYAYLKKGESPEGPPCHPAIATFRPQAGRQGFTLCGHRLASLYRVASVRLFRLIADYQAAFILCEIRMSTTLKMRDDWRRFA